MASALKEYHYAWLSAHPTRNKDWLRFMLKAGFDIHHLDGDHSNNNPENLVLIEHVDHMRLHGMTGTNGRMKMQHVLEVQKKKRHALYMQEGEIAYTAAYEIAERSGFNRREPIWTAAAKSSGIKCSKKTLARAMFYAKQTGKKWPLTHPSVNSGHKATG